MHKSIFILLLLAMLRSGICAAFDFADVRVSAQAIAAKPYQPSTNRIPESLSRLGYLEHRAIEFDQEKALWRRDRLPFQVEFFHPGAAAKQIVLIHEITDSGVRLIPFSPNYFKFGGQKLETPPGFAGFRLVHMTKDAQEFAVFLGASYFRMIGAGQTYGASARGLALNTLGPDGEEFPVFEQFWIRRPARNSGAITVFALLDSPSATGAFQFVIRPGTDTVATVKAVLFPRREVVEFGLASLTSMFSHGENGRQMSTDFRPEVHDTDGLLIHNGADEWLWHPLEAGATIRVNTFLDEHPRGFGLMQRDRDFEHYQDLVAHYERRPNVWVRPVGNWGRGVVKLIQLPSGKEFVDNVVAFWQPASPPKPGATVELEYELHWTKTDPVPATLGRVRATRIGRVEQSPTPNIRFVVDFEGERMAAIRPNDKLSVNLDHSPDVKVVAQDVMRNSTNGTVRLVLEIADPGRAADVRAFLRHDDRRLTETWTYTWQP